MTLPTQNCSSFVITFQVRWLSKSVPSTNCGLTIQVVDVVICLFFSGSSAGFETHWEANPDETKKNQSYVYYTLGNLQPNTGYQFRIIAHNAMGKSDPSDPSDKVFTGRSFNLKMMGTQETFAILCAYRTTLLIF